MMHKFIIFSILITFLSCGNSQKRTREILDNDSNKLSESSFFQSESSIFLQIINESSILKSDHDLKSYFNKFISKKADPINKDLVLKYSEVLSYSSKVNKKILSCSSFIESLFVQNAQSKYAKGIAQLRDSTVNEILTKIQDNDFSKYKTCSQYVPGFDYDHTYERYLMKFNCGHSDKTCENYVDTCSSSYRNIYRAQKYLFFARNFFNNDDEIPLKMDSGINGYDPFNLRQALFLSNYLYYDFATKIDGYLAWRLSEKIPNPSLEEIRTYIKSMLKTEEDKFRAMQLMIGAYNTGFGRIRSSLRNLKLKNFTEIYENHLKIAKTQPWGIQNISHIMKAGRCLFQNDYRKPFDVDEVDALDI